MEDRFNFRIPEFTDKNKFIGFQYIELGDSIDELLAGHLGEPQQCTGLKDINGKLIYEGDIVKFIDFLHEESKGTVIFNDRCASFFVAKIVKFYPLTEFVNVNRYDLKILGNIYENPELLEGENR